MNVEKRELRPMLAKDTTIEAEEGKLLILQPKLNGVRGIFCPDEGIVRSREGLWLPSTASLCKEIEALGLQRAWLDGELFLAGIPFEDLNGLIRREEDFPDLQLWVFDLMVDGISQRDRLKVLDAIEWGVHVRKVPWVESTKIEVAYEQVLGSGYEGLILRDPGAFYVHKRSSHLRRIKPVYRIHAILVGFNPAVGDRNKDTFGSLKLRTPSGIEFNCSGLTDVERKVLWAQKPVGALVEVECGAFSKKGTPVFPRFKGLVGKEGL